jgi:hypothetical protein
MLLFEFFPLFVMAVSVVVGVWLFSLDRQFRRSEADPNAQIQASRGSKRVAEAEERVR